MQYFGRAIGSVSKTWNSINPATLSGAIDVIVVEDENGERHCSPFHVRFGKFQLLRPSQKKVTFIVNGETTDIPMKLNDEGEAFFVFKTDGYVPKHLQTSPVVSALSSPSESPRMTPSSAGGESLEYLDIGEGVSDSNSNSNSPNSNKSDSELLKNKKNISRSPIERAKEITRKLNIPSKVETNGDIYLDLDGYKSENMDANDTNVLVKQILEDEFGDDIDVQSMMDKDMKGNIRILNSTFDNNNSSSNINSSSLLSDNSTSSEPSSPNSILNNESQFKSGINTPEESTNENAEIPPLPKAKSSTDEILNSETLEKSSSTSSSTINSNLNNNTNNNDKENKENEESVHFKSLRLTSEQLKCLSLNYGENDITYSVNNGKSIIVCKLFLWKRETPIVISDIDGTITKSDALGHVLTMLGRDWTHEGVAKLFEDIEFNGYNIMYLTARSVGLADTTRSYLQGVEQDGYKLPIGPVILSPDRTIAALRREIVLKKPEVFKMACLNDIRTLYYPESKAIINEEKKHILDEYKNDLRKQLESDKLNKAENVNEFKELNNNKNDNNSNSNDINENINEHERDIENLSDSDEFTDINTNTSGTKISELKDDHISAIVDETNTPFYAGFGNRITDAISYRSVGIPSSRIFTINPEGDVKMELLELAGFKSSYVSIVELVDQFFPPVNIKSNNKSVDNSLEMSMSNAKNKYTEFNFWRNPDIDLSLISDDDDGDDDVEEVEKEKDGVEEDDKNKTDNKDQEKEEKGGKEFDTGLFYRNDDDNIMAEVNKEGEYDKERKENNKKQIKEGNIKEEAINIVGKGKNEGRKEEANEEEEEEEEEAENEDDVKSIGSRFSFFLRSPILSPRKNEQNERKDVETHFDSIDNIGDELVDDSKVFPTTNQDQEHDNISERGGYNEGDSRNISLMSDEDEDEDEDEESDSDYIYETSEDEEDIEENEDEDEDDDVEEEEQNHEESDLESQRIKKGYNKDDENESVIDSDSTYWKDHVKNDKNRNEKLEVVNKNTRSSSVSGVNNEKIHGEFV